MSGHHGNKSVTLLNVQIVDVNEEKGYILIKGGVPGPRKAIVMIRTAVKVVKHPDVVKNLLVRVKEEPKVEEPAAQTPVAEAPVAEAPAAEAPVAEPATEESK